MYPMEGEFPPCVQVFKVFTKIGMESGKPYVVGSQGACVIKSQDNVTAVQIMMPDQPELRGLGWKQRSFGERAVQSLVQLMQSNGCAVSVSDKEISQTDFRKGKLVKVYTFTK